MEIAPLIWKGHIKIFSVACVWCIWCTVGSAFDGFFLFQSNFKGLLCCVKYCDFLELPMKYELLVCPEQYTISVTETRAIDWLSCSFLFLNFFEWNDFMMQTITFFCFLLMWPKLLFMGTDSHKEHLLLFNKIHWNFFEKFGLEFEQERNGKMMKWKYSHWFDKIKGSLYGKSENNPFG